MDPIDPKPAQAPAQPGEQKPQNEVKPAEGPTGLDALAKDPEALKRLYERSPELFEKAGLVRKQQEAAAQQKPVEPTPAKSAAPKYGDVEIKVPDDVPVQPGALETYLAHAKEMGLSAEQVQKQVDWNVAQWRKQAAPAPQPQQPQPKPPAPSELDAANVTKLKADQEFFGGSEDKFKENMEIARQAAVKYAGPEVLERLKTSDPVLVKHFFKLGLKDSEDRTRGAPNRSGEEGTSNKDPYRGRFPNSPTMFPNSQ